MMRALLLLLLSAATAVAEPDAASYVLAQLQIVQMPQARALAVVPRLLDPQTAAAAYAEIQEGVAREEIKLVDHLWAEARSGQRTVCTQQEERKIPIEFNLDDPAIGPAPEHFAKGRERIATSYGISRFEMRNCGASLEFQAAVREDGQRVTVNIGAAMTDFEGWDRYENAVRASGLVLYYETPIVRMRKTETSFSFPPALPQLLGVFQLPGGVTELHLFTVRVRQLAALRTAATATPESVEPTPAVKPGQIVLELHRFHVSPGDAIPLRASLQDSHRVEAAFGKLLEATAQGRAQLVEWQVVPAAPAGTARVINCVERRYGTLDFHRGPLPFHGAYIPPRAFEVKDTGQYLEIIMDEAWEGSVAKFSCRFDIAALSDFRRWAAPPTASGFRTFAFEPSFNTRTIAHSVTLVPGQRKLVGFNRLPDSLLGPQGQFEIVLLRNVPRNPLPNHAQP